MTIKWGEEFELGIPEIDKNNKKLIEILNIFYEKIGNGDGRKETIDQFLSELENYLTNSLKFEEEFMEKAKYPDLENHKKLHRMFKKLYEEEKAKYLKGDAKAIGDVIAFTISWLYSHITKTDKKFAEFYKKSNHA